MRNRFWMTPCTVRESLGLLWRLEPAHLSLSLSRRLMRDFGPVVRIPARVMAHRRHDVPPCRTVAPELVGDQPPGFATLTLEQLSKEALCGAPITTRLDEDVDHIAVLVDGTPEILTLALDADEELVQVPRIAQSPFSPPQCPRVLGADLSAPVANALVGDGDSTLRQEILDVSEAQAEPVIQPDGVADDLGWEPVAAVAGCAAVHLPTLPPMSSS